ncbi:MAG: BrnA antitoxin family protein [Pseudomonadota bacterium]|nr:BrnA antitoxin family protein [Pseudomonadota bacterium]
MSDEDEPFEWSDEMFDRARISVGGVVVREASGTITKRGRPPVAGEAKQQVTLRLAPQVVRYFKATGSGWQTRLNAVLERHVAMNQTADGKK